MENGPSHVIFASNTSTISITDIAKDSGAPERVCGMHFFNPVILMRLIEVIKGDQTSDDTLNTAMAVGKSLPLLKGKRYIAAVLKDRPGFIVNRINAPVQMYLSWCYDKCAEEGKTWEQLDADAGGKMPMPPCMLVDFIGIDTFLHILNYYNGKLSPDFKPGKTITDLYDSGNLGQKTGKGFYDWSEGRAAILDRIKASEPAGIFDIGTTFAILLNEGCRILEEGITTGFKIIDDSNMAGMKLCIAQIYNVNTPGPFGAGKKNFEKWAEMLNELAEKTGIEYLKPCELMKTGGFIKMRK